MVKRKTQHQRLTTAIKTGKNPWKKGSQAYEDFERFNPKSRTNRKSK